MRAGQWKTRFTRVIEFPFFPRHRTVTLPALGVRAETPLMVTVLVTASALQRRIFVVRRIMASLARRRHMLADERKPRLIVIERDVLSPIRIIVTSLAAFA